MPTPSPRFFCNVDDEVSLDQTFLADKERICANLPLSLKQNPTAAPSSILRCVLSRGVSGTTTTAASSPLHAPQKPQQQEQQQHVKEGAVVAEPGKITVASTSPASTAHVTPVPAPASAGPSLLGRATRGLQAKDPLIKRFAAKKAAAAASGAASAMSSHHRSTPPATATAATTGGAGTPPPSHWSERPLCEMSTAGWSVFRSEVGIEVEVVRYRSSASHQNPLAATAAAVCPIRSWGEAKLPYALGYIVALMFALPTAVQSQCVPMLMQGYLSQPAAVATTTTSTSDALSSSPPTPDGGGDTRKHDLLAVAETGGGKTAAYIIPAIADVLQNRPKLLGNDELISLGPFVLVVVPTRELAEQVFAETQKIINGKILLDSSSSKQTQKCHSSVQALVEEELAGVVAGDHHAEEDGGAAYRKSHNLLDELRVVKVVGGESTDAQHERLAAGAHMVVGTVGQLHALLEARLLSLGNTRMVIVDEADRMIEENQKDYLDAVLQRAPTVNRQTALFTATLSSSCEQMARQYLSQSGYFVVRTPYRCPTVLQSFEVVSDTVATASAATGGATSRLGRSAAKVRRTETETELEVAPGMREDGGPLPFGLHPLKFSRLVTWLLYAPPPVIVFANEKKICDALQEALLHEAQRLREYPEVSLREFVGAPPESLAFLQEGSVRSSARLGSSQAAATARASLANLTSVAVVHSEQSQAERRRLVECFQRGERRVLVTTDLLARGLDVAGVTLVVNYDLPRPWLSDKETRRNAAAVEEAMALYIHRIGRTGRAGAKGVTLSLVCLPEDTLTQLQKRANEEENADGSGGNAVSGRVRWGAEDDEGKERREDDDDDEDDDDEEEDNHGGRKRRLTGSHAGLEGEASIQRFPEDTALLPALWKFLVGIVESNAMPSSTNNVLNAGRTLKDNRFERIQLPSALSTMMFSAAEGHNLTALTL